MSTGELLVIIPAAIVLLVLCAAFICYRMAFYVPREKTMNPHRLLEGEQYEVLAEKTHRLIDQALAIPFEEVSVRSADGLLLAGKFYEAAPGAPVQILFHGYQSIAIRDFSGGLQLALENGCNVILVDERAHGKSEGRYLSFGIQEREDVMCWICYAKERFGDNVPIILTGISMGAATVLMASELALPGNVRGIIADSPYSSPEAIIRKVIRDRHYPVGPAYLLVALGARVYGHIGLDQCSAVEAVKKTRIPVLIIHGEDDRFVPCSMSREIYTHCASEKHLLTVPGAGHGLSYMVDNEAYKTAVKQFLEMVLQ